jgi:hypothetical protein
MPQGALRPNGIFVFPLKHAVERLLDVNYHLELHGRYSHGRAYVKQCLRAPDFVCKSRRRRCKWSRAYRSEDWSCERRRQFDLAPCISQIASQYLRLSNYLRLEQRHQNHWLTYALFLPSNAAISTSQSSPSQDREGLTMLAPDNEVNSYRTAAADNVVPCLNVEAPRESLGDTISADN